jgi:UDP-N-acetylmuramoyl-tripeptide--D-alanyl-D-alanine ligase
MEPRPLRFFAEACDGELCDVDGGRVVKRVCTDTRDLRAGDLFVALGGDRFDGHDYVGEALRSGAVAAVVARRQAGRFEGVPRLEVADPRRALGRMAGRYRSEFRIPVVAVAGSNGKTTTKEILGGVLGGCFETLRSRDSFNNDIGVPVTLLGLESRHVAAVVEVGTNHPGELAPLLRLACPRIGVLTHIGEEHLEHFGSVAGVVEEEGWVADLLPPDGLLVLPGDQPWTDAVVARTRARVVRTGTASGCDWQVVGMEVDADGTTFAVRCVRPELNGEYRVNLVGRHQVSNAVLALAVAAEFGLGRDELRRGLLSCGPAKWRMNRWEFEGVQVIEDCYNANPDSMAAALETLRGFPCSGRRVVVMGGMAELGRHGPRAHARMGHRVAELGLDWLVGVGRDAALAVDAAVGEGMGSAVAVDAVEGAAAALRAYLRPGDCLLIKGSRSARLERLGALLREQPTLQHAA